MKLREIDFGNDCYYSIRKLLLARIYKRLMLPDVLNAIEMSVLL
jgi:hypothetical protein